MCGQKRLVQRRIGRAAKRMKVAGLTEAGRTLLARLEPGVARANERMTVRCRRKPGNGSWPTCDDSWQQMIN
jgi:DNA-binding MarR family transcriptional regulator